MLMILTWDYDACSIHNLYLLDLCEIFLQSYYYA